MGRAYGTYKEKKKCVTGYRWGNLTESEQLVNFGVDGRII
jgi:hypothetical protein